MSADTIKARWAENSERKKRIRLIVMGKPAFCESAIKAAAQEEAQSQYTQEPKRTEN